MISEMSFSFKRNETLFMRKNRNSLLKMKGGSMPYMYTINIIINIPM